MAARSDHGDYQRVRWRLYLETQLARGVPSRAKLAEALDLPTSRVSQWLAGERGIEAGTAYVVGDLLRTRFELDTSGCDALFAAGCFTDLVRLLRAASYDPTDGAHERVVALYCSLPAAFLALEVDALDAYERTLPAYRPTAFERHESSRLRRDREIAIALARNGALPEIRLDARRLLASNEAASHVALAWQRAQRPLDVPKVVMRSALAPPPPMPMAVHAIAETASATAPSRARYLEEIAPVTPPPVEAISALAEVVIALARALESRNPSLTAPRLWRMLAEWAFELDPLAFERYSPLLPETYAHFATHRTP